MPQQPIPGGAMTQVAQVAGNPEVVGLSPGQAQQARDMVTPKEPIPMYDPVNYPEYSPTTGEPIIHKVFDPDGTIYKIRGPADSTYKQAIERLKAMPPEERATYASDDSMSSIPEEPQDMTLRNKGQLITQGTMLGFGDEATALLAATTAKLATMLPGEQAGEDSSFGDMYRDIVGAERAMLEKARADNPKEALAYEIGGGVVSGIGGLNRIAGKTLMQKAGVGAGFGGTYGAGAADPEEGGLAGLGERAKEGAVGAAIGGVLAPGLSVAGDKTMKAIRGRRMKTADSRKVLTDKIEQSYMVNRSMGDSNTNAYRAALKEHKVSGKDALTLQRESGKYLTRYRLTPEQASDRIAADGLMKKGVAHKGAMKLIDSVIEPVATRIEKHSPRIAQVLRNYEANVYRDVHNWHTRLEPFIGRVRSLKTADKTRFGQMMYNSQFEDAKKLLVASSRGVDSKAVLKDFDDGLAIINNVADQMEKAGAGFDRVPLYFPRRIKGEEGLKGIKELLGTEYLTGFKKVSEALRQKGSTREANALNAYMRGVPMSKRRETALRSRKVRQVTDEMMDFYEDPIASLDLFLRDAAQQIHRRRMLSQGGKLEIVERMVGKNKKAAIEDVEESLDNMVDLLKDPNLSDDAVNEIADLLKVRFTAGELGMDKTMSNIKTIAHNSLLGDSVSAATQLGDIGASAWINGFFPSMKALVRAMAGKNKLTAEDLGIMREMVNEISDPGSLNRVSDFIFRNSGLKVLPSFRAVDRLGKNVAINSAFSNATKKASTRNGKAALTKELGPAWGKDTPQLVKDLEAGKITDLSKQYIFTQLSKMQPISRSEMPEQFLRMRNGRITYQLMTWTMKQFSLFRNRSLNKIANGNAKEKAAGLKDMARAYVYLGGANLTSDEVKRLMMNRDSTFQGRRDVAAELPQILFEHALKNFTGSKNYLEGATAPLGSIVGRLGVKGKRAWDSGEFGSEQSQDFSAGMVNQLPFIGKLANNWLMGGAEKFNERQEAERKAAAREHRKR